MAAEEYQIGVGLGQESHDNPFTDEGELSKKADYILRHSTISARELRISDPDLRKNRPVEEVPLQAMSANQAQAAPDQVDGAARPNQINVKENGKVEQPLTPQSVEVEVGTANATQAQPQQAEQVKVKDDKKCKCCVVM